jgi:predicted GIY-YIG superfamily endonuclease
MGTAFYYVYMLRSLADPERHYIGRTDNLRTRLEKHNHGEVPHTTKYKPWKIKTAIAFTDHDRAVAFERYLKTASGRLARAYGYMFRRPLLDWRGFAENTGSQVNSFGGSACVIATIREAVRGGRASY